MNVRKFTFLWSIVSSSANRKTDFEHFFFTFTKISCQSSTYESTFSTVMMSPTRKDPLSSDSFTSGLKGKLLQESQYSIVIWMIYGMKCTPSLTNSKHSAIDKPWYISFHCLVCLIYERLNLSSPTYSILANFISNDEDIAFGAGQWYWLQK